MSDIAAIGPSNDAGMAMNLPARPLHGLAAAIAFLAACPADSKSRFGPDYPGEAAAVKRMLGKQENARSLLYFVDSDADPTARVMVFDPYDKLFCRTPAFAAGARIFPKGGKIDRTVKMYCENGLEGTARVVRVKGKTCRANIDIRDGPRLVEDYSCD